MADRPSAAQPVSKRRAGEQVTKNDVELEEDEDADGEARDPGSWAPVTDEAIKRRRKVHVRRGGAGTAEPVAVPEAAAPAAPGGNPFAGIALTAPSGQPPTGNPFASITLVAPAEKAAAEPAQPAATPQDTDQASGPPTAASHPGAQAAPAAAPPADAQLATKDDAAALAPAAEAAPAAAGEASAAATQAGSAGEPTSAGGASEKEEAAGASATPAGFGSGGSFSGFAGFGTGTLGSGTGGFG
ncbi:RanBD1 domain-containing protein, partial [Haematococcus lacustris]